MPTLVDALARSAAEHPTGEAVRLRGRSLDYAGLDRASSALAATMREAGVVRGDRVGLWLGKSVETVVAVHAVLKCGAAYVPVDPAVPPARAAYLLKDCAVACLITDRGRLDLLAPDARGPGGERPGTGDWSAAVRLVVVVDGETAEDTGDSEDTVDTVDRQAADSAAPPAAVLPRLGWARAALRPVPAGFRPTPVTPGDLAYILYTSGSTGVPKGVMLSHRNARAFVDWAVEEFRVTSEDRLASHAPVHFDLSVLDLFAAAATGACLVLVPENHKALGMALNRLVVAEKISVWYSVPGALVRMLDARNSAELASSGLRTVLFAGEPFPLKHLRRLRGALPGAELYNLYGPTETNVCTFHRVTDADLAPDRVAPPPIGTPCPYATTTVLDANGRVVPDSAGAEGELAVGGDSVMLGYWTPAGPPAEPAPVHRTGDIVRSDGAGTYTFAGRRDHMVKVRGYRIEPGEIEATLLALPEVHEAVCVAVGAEEDDVRLEAFVVPRSGASADEARLRHHCALTLPRYMVPARFAVVDGLPRTSTGKADRRALADAAARSEEGPCPPES
ncbi:MULTISPECIES: amino acid adenylation domain-containing protein [Streptomyces]|uniref:amino acid adenylation domain-containing protein n=1 Tax=Streptomyces TaxID=1883 RepID=UPI001E3F1C28|nr:MULTISPECIES: amino acid adenylation domain-containing protein [Streptomyces]UFQ13726.1 amino acid adenylation domain-containing protein [Streptomyces huasconensis]WCL83321.1 amino acid adenylation domain-containing protein [Streptomyces sp. JCM 35825]